MAVFKKILGNVNKATQKGSKYARMIASVEPIPTRRNKAQRWHLFSIIKININEIYNIMLLPFSKHKLGSGVMYL